MKFFEGKKKSSFPKKNDQGQQHAEVTPIPSVMGDSFLQSPAAQEPKAAPLADNLRNPLPPVTKELAETHGSEQKSVAVATDGKIPQQFGRYQILALLGRGGMGQVFKTYDPVLRRNVALKLLLIAGQGNEKNIERFLREARTTAQLCHPNIVAVHDIGIEDSQPYFTMDLVEGCSLKDLVKKSSFPIRRIVEIMIHVGNAIHYAHRNGVIHRDLKPANIMMGKNQEPKVMDFGLAKVTNASKNLSQSGAVLGTLQYMPPEQAEGRSRNVDERSDVYGLGAILYEMLTDMPPFHSDSSMNLMYKIFNEDPIPPTEIKPRIPKDLESICLKALEKKKEARYQSAAEFVDDLTRFSRGEAVMAHPNGLGRWGKKVRKHKALAALVAALLIMIAGAAYFRGGEAAKKTEWKKQSGGQVDGSRPDRELSKRVERPKPTDQPQTPTNQPRTPKSEAKIKMFGGDLQHTGVFSAGQCPDPARWKWRIKKTVGFAADEMVFAASNCVLYGLDRNGEEKWYFRAPSTPVFPVVVDGIIYFTTVGDGVCRAVDIKTRQEKWNFSQKSTSWPEYGSNVWSHPVIDDETIYFNYNDGRLYALDLENGREKWVFPAKQSDWLILSPSVWNKAIYFNDKNNFYAVDSDNGLERWQLPIPVLSWCAIVDGVGYFISQNGHLYAINLEAGEEIWKFPMPGNPGYGISVAKGIVYAGGENVVYAVDASSRLKLREYPISGLCRTLAYADGVLYIGTDNGWLYAFDTTVADAKYAKWRWLTDAGGRVHITYIGEGWIYITTGSTLEFPFDAIHIATAERTGGVIPCDEEDLIMLKPMKITNAIEGETMTIVSVSQGIAKPQQTLKIGDMDLTGRWSADGQLLWKITQPKQRLVLSFPAKAGRYRIQAYFTNGMAYGTHRISINNQKVDEPIDLFYDCSWPADFFPAHSPVDLGVFDLKPKDNLIEIEVIDKNPQSKDYYFGLDCIVLD